MNEELKKHVTKGVVTVTPNYSNGSHENVHAGIEVDQWHVCAVWDDCGASVQDALTTAKANTQLIAEAFAVYTGFGMTPIELRERVHELEAAKVELLSALTDQWASMTGGEKQCGHQYTCICPDKKTLDLIAKYRK